VKRRDVLGASGGLAAASIAGCLGSLGLEDGGDGSSDFPTGTADAPTERLSELVTGNAAFALDLHDRLVDADGGNLIVSPYSVSTALAMTYAGARGETRDEMARTLAFPEEADVHGAFATLREALDSRAELDERDDGGDPFRLETANSLWGQAGYPFSESFLSTLETHYGAGLREADFVSQHETERQRINEWVADRTEDRIDELLPRGTIRPTTRLVLTNAIYFLAGWDAVFDAENTEDGTFTRLDGSEASVPLMQDHFETQYADVNGLEAVELPYVGEDVSMVCLLPPEGEFETVERSLDGESLLGVFEELSSGRGDVVLPRFEFESAFRLSDHLGALGMPSAFTDQANFAGMNEDGDRDLFVDAVIHDTFVAVDEEGTEAAGATAVVMAGTDGHADARPPDWGEIRFDRPFLFCIRDRPTDSVLFFGRVVDAGAAGPGD